MTPSPSPSTKNQCSDNVTGAANLSKNKDIISAQVEDENEEDEEGDMDFNPFLKEALSIEASSSLSSEIEEFDADVINSRETQSHSPVVNVTNAPDELQGDSIKTVTVEGSQKPDSDDEDAIWRRTRARYSLVGSTLDELETFLQETDDEDDLHHNIDDEKEYRKFLAAVLNNGDSSSGAPQENDNFDEDEDNDADFELELEEALESDVDEMLHNSCQQREHERRPETRQKKRQKTNVRKNEFPSHSNRPLRPILPYAPISPTNKYMIQTNSSTYNDYVSAFTPYQIGQLHCLIYEHVQLLIQLFSLSILEPSRQHFATQVHRLLSEMLTMRDQALASRSVPYPSFCFSASYVHSTVIPTDGTFFVPFVSDNILSVLDVAPLNLVQSYINDVNIAVEGHQQRQLEVAYDATVDKECLFPFNNTHSSDTTAVPDKAVDPKSKKTIAAALVERSKNQSIALVPKDISKLALRFFPLFNPALFPHKPPPSSVANRVLFTDSEDWLLARGLIRYNTDWKEIQKYFLPCKTPHQIFVRQKNRACSRAPENPIKAVRRMKTSPLTPQEKAVIEEGLNIYKLDWMAVWKYMLPHRDPSMLPRQYRASVGNQKSYKSDEHTKAKRRAYELQKRNSKLQSSTLQSTGQGWSTEEEANTLPSFPTIFSNENGGGENNSGDDGGNNEDEAYVHEAFLADFRPIENPQVELFASDPKLVNLHPHNASSSYRVPAKVLRAEVNIRPYRARRSNCSRVVKLAPDLPPVNLPPTVRVMSQSAFSKFQEARQNVVLSQRTGQQDGDNNAVEKGDSDLQLHPLLFQDHADGSLPYYPLNGSASCSSSFDFFHDNNPSQLNLNLFRFSNQAKHTKNFFNNSLKSKELTSSLTGVDFHPLLQRSDDTPLDVSTSNPTAVNVVPHSPNELDLDIRLSSMAQKENGDDVADARHDEIVMEQEELSDSEDDDMAESVEFECEEMTDSEGDGGSDSDHVEKVQYENVQDDCLPKLMVQGDDSDQDEQRCPETAKSDEPLSLLGVNLNPKLPVTRISSSTKKTHRQLDSVTHEKKSRTRAQKLDPK